MAWILMSPGVGATEVLIINLSIGDYLFMQKYPLDPFHHLHNVFVKYHYS